ncbi:outer membrane protein assembly factor BamE [bacterium]|nr:outer membrane protein assembly factor BamE [bacterium]
MKKLLVTIIIFLMGIPALAKAHKDFCMQIGTSKAEVSKAFGKPDIITVDSEDKLTWIYLNVKKEPTQKIKRSERLNKSEQSTILTIKFDTDENISGYSYMTTYNGEEND